MFDCYQLPGDWPGKKSVGDKPPSDKAKIMEQAIQRRISDCLGDNPGPNRFILCIQMREFEALRCSEPCKLGKEAALNDHPQRAIRALQQVADSFETPGEIDERATTAPSKRIRSLAKRYQKVTDGHRAAALIGLEAMRQRRPHFDEWLSSLESLGQRAFQRGVPASGSAPADGAPAFSVFGPAAFSAAFLSARSQKELGDQEEFQDLRKEVQGQAACCTRDAIFGSFGTSKNRLPRSNLSELRACRRGRSRSRPCDFAFLVEIRNGHSAPGEAIHFFGQTPNASAFRREKASPPGSAAWPNETGISNCFLQPLRGDPAPQAIPWPDTFGRPTQWRILRLVVRGLDAK